MPTLKANVGFLGQLPVIGPAENEDRSDYRAVPASDRGNDGYHDRGGFGTYQSDAEPFASPSDVKYFAGYGAQEEDLRRGYCDVSISDDPAYDLRSYKDRSSQPQHPSGVSDFQFRNERSRGFLTRPRIPTER